MTVINNYWDVVCIERPQYSFKTMTPFDSLSLITESKKLPHPYEKRNEKMFLWLGQSEWRCESFFDVNEKDFLEKAHILILERVDTIADVYINDSFVGKCDNYFSNHYFNIKPFVRKGKNKIGIIIHGAESEALKEAEKLPYPVPHSQYPVQSPHRNLIRKTQCHSGWDWGGNFMVSGIYKEPSIVFCDGVIIEGVIPNLTPIGEIADGGRWELFADAHLRNLTDEIVSLDEIKVEIGKINAVSNLKNITCGVGSSCYTIKLEISGGQLWFPSGYGKQTLYEIKTVIAKHEWKSKIGLREIKIKNEEDEHGKSMTFSVNGVDIFCKGGNFIPLDSMPSLESEERYRYILSSMKEANMNMIRVWGGGQFEHDVFYDICDELGILIWHDFIFACSLYPSTDDFLDNVRSETENILKRLSHHASIALWCGNNENLGAINWFDISRENPNRYVIDYDRLNNGVLAKTVKRLDRTRVWWPSSPCAGENDYTDAFHDDTKGDMHNWMVWHEGKPFESYLDVKPRFCSEFGFQSFPSMSAIYSYAGKDGVNPTSPDMLYHQRNPKGNQIIIETLSRYFRFPFKMEDFVYLSQVSQAWAMKYAVDAWRSSRDICMGTLYWQINDVWPVASWSSIEYSGHWKLLHYEAKRFYEDLYGCLYVHQNKIIGFLINDKTQDIEVEYKIIRMHFNGNVLFEKENKMILKRQSSSNIFSQNIDEMNEGDRNSEFMFIMYKDRRDKNYRRSFSFLTLPRECEIEKANVCYSLENDGNDIFVVLETDKPAFYVCIETETEEDRKLISERKNFQKRERFSDNNIMLTPNEKVKIKYIGEKTLKQLTESVYIRHLRNTY